MVGDDGQGLYVLRCGRGQHAIRVDAEDIDLLEASPLRFLNTWRAGSVVRAGAAKSNNVRISGGSRPVQSGGVAYCSLVASRHVAAGAELLLAYGRGYHV